MHFRFAPRFTAVDDFGFAFFSISHPLTDETIILSLKCSLFLVFLVAANAADKFAKFSELLTGINVQLLC